jgi:hypothetical protein
MECMVSMISGEPVDMQRERRWPSSGMQKTFKPERGDPGYNSDEDIEEDVQLGPPDIMDQD